MCEQDALEPLKPTPADRARAKEDLIDLWLFADTYDIPKLQNLVMRDLCIIFIQPSLLLDSDIEKVYLQAKAADCPLKNLVVYVMVVQLEAEDAKKGIEHYAALAPYPGFLGAIYRSLKMWVLFQPTSGGKGRGKKTKWGLFVERKDVEESLLVKEAVVVAPKKVVAGNGVVKKASAAQCAGPAGKGKGDIEMIDLTDD